MDSHSVLGPWLVTANEIENPDNLDISLAVNWQDQATVKYQSNDLFDSSN